ncbi:MAG: hypothetical protein DPW16_18825 [Chloroflexi bacterium]|nr:hypothetical protein [Chloroflexota bacterium]
MAQKHPVFEEPEDTNSNVWRYMDFARFMSLLDKRALFFVTGNLLRKLDPFEGSFSKANLALRPYIYENLPSQTRDFIQESITTSFRTTLPNMVLINCWHLSDFESAAMWELYSRYSLGIAIQSTFNQLKFSIQDRLGVDKVLVGKVKYIDYTTDWIPENNIFYPYTHKRKNFEHEREIRAITTTWAGDLEEHASSVKHELDKFGGVYIPVDLEILISKIYVSPTSPLWFRDLATSILRQYKLEKDVVQSNLSDDPVY